jgi:hypothetical protein
MRPIFMRLVPCALALALGASVVHADNAGTPPHARRYQATRNITVDRVTGQLRKPTADEVADLVKTLESLTLVPGDGAQGVALKGGGKAMNLQGASAGVMLARPGADGTMETRCVFSFEEGAEFLGLVADDSEQ